MYNLHPCFIGIYYSTADCCLKHNCIYLLWWTLFIPVQSHSHCLFSGHLSHATFLQDCFSQLPTPPCISLSLSMTLPPHPSLPNAEVFLSYIKKNFPCSCVHSWYPPPTSLHSCTIPNYLYLLPSSFAYVPPFPHIPLRFHNDLFSISLNPKCHSQSPKHHRMTETPPFHFANLMSLGYQNMTAHRKRTVKQEQQTDFS